MKKLNLLSLGMTGWLLFAGCDTVVRVTDDVDSTEGEPAYASFALNIKDTKTYAGDTDEAGQGNENAIRDALLLVYKFDGASSSPEMMGYIATADILAESQENSEATARVTLKTVSGRKLIYLATNVGGNKLVNAGQTTTNVSEANGWSDISALVIPFATVNTPVWSTGASSITISSTVGTATTADGLIKALSGNGDPFQGVLSGIGTAYLMSNWGGQPDGGDTGTDYASTCEFHIKAGISAEESRMATPDATNTNGKNALLINIQRALAMIAMEAIPSQVLNNVGSGGNAGVFVPDDKWAVGNINMSIYPFQQYDGSTVKSTRYDETAPIFPANNNQNWENKMDNSRWVPAGKIYGQQNLTVTEVRNQINSNPANQPFGLSNKVLITENNNKYPSLQAYSTFVLYSGQYRPNSYITGFSKANVETNPAIVSVSNTFPTSWPATNPVTNEQTDTLYYVSNIQTFFLGKRALQQYVAWVYLQKPAITDPASSFEVADVINEWKNMRELQAYFRGYCFYRGFIMDNSATSPANRALVRRNHIYYLSVTGISGPGIGEVFEYESIDPPIIDVSTYATTQIRIMNWHIVHQAMENGND